MAAGEPTLEGLIVSVPLSEPAKGAVAGILNFAIRFDERTHAWEAFVPALEAYQGGLGDQQAAIEWATGQVASGIVEGRVASPEPGPRPRRLAYPFAASHQSPLSASCTSSSSSPLSGTGAGSGSMATTQAAG
jgi:hypothetical protein